MTATRSAAVFVGLSPVVLLTALLAAAQMDGKTVFVEKKCHGCHSIDSAGISSRQAPHPLASSIDWQRHCDGCTPDLSTIGERRNAEWLKAYLKCKKNGPNGQKHNGIYLKGSPAGIAWRFASDDVPLFADKSDDAALDALVTWLVTLGKR